MYALFPLVVSALVCGLLGAWLLHEGRGRRQPALRWAGATLVAVLALVLAGLCAAALVPGAGAGLRTGVVALAGLLVLAAAALAAGAALQARRGPPARLVGPGILSATLLVPAIGLIAACFLLSVLLALSNGTLGF